MTNCHILSQANNKDSVFNKPTILLPELGWLQGQPFFFEGEETESHGTVCAGRENAQNALLGRWAEPDNEETSPSQKH